MSSAAPPFSETRAGGRCTIRDERSRDPANPYFQSVRRWAAADDGLPGAGRFGGSMSTIWRQARNRPVAHGPACVDLGDDRSRRAIAGEGVGRAQDDHLHPVGQCDHRDGLPGAGLLQSRAQQQRRVGGGRVADGVDEGIHEATAPRAHGLHGRPDGSAVEPGDREAVDAGSALQPAVGECRGPGLGRHGCVGMGAETLLPRSRPRSAGNPPAFGDLQRAGRPRPGIRPSPARRRSSPTSTAALHRRQRPRRHRSADRHGHPRPPPASRRPRRGQRRSQGSDARTDRAAEVVGGHRRVEPQSGMDGRGVGLLEIGRCRRREPERTGAVAVARSARSAAAWPIVVVSSS